MPSAIKLHQFPSAWSLPNASPFCLKLETYLRMTNRPFEVVTIIDPRKSPKGKLPIIIDDGKKIADSGFIIKYLQEKYGDSLDDHLTAEQKAQAVAISRLLEEHFYWVLVYSRWIDERFWPITKNEFFSHLKGPIRYFVPKLIQKSVKTQLYQQGVGRHTSAEIYQLGIENLQALSVFLGQNNFMMGNEPSSIDACVYGFLANIIYPPLPSPLQDFAKSQANFIAYCERMKERFYVTES